VHIDPLNEIRFPDVLNHAFLAVDASCENLPTPPPTPTPPPPCEPQANDDISSSTPISALPFADQVNTVCATTAPDDPDCFGRGATVWYSFTSPADRRIEVNTFGSDYDTTLSAYTGSPGALSQVACNDDAGSRQSRILFDAAAGETYYFMAGSFLDGPGGSLVLNVDLGPPPLEIDVIIDPRGLVAVKDGTATISGTVTCSAPAFVDVFGELRQKAGRAELFGFGSTFVECNGYAVWSAQVEAENGKWAGGRAEASVSAIGFSDFEFDEDQAGGPVQLRGTRPQQPAPTRCPRDGNFGFEAGAVDSNEIPCWTVTDLGPGSWCTQAGTAPPIGSCPGGVAVVPPPPEGAQGAMAAQGGPGAHLLYRCGTLRSGSLGFQLYLNNQAGIFVSAPTLDPFAEANQQFRADLVRATAIDADPFTVNPADVLMNLYQTGPGDPLQSGYLQVTADANAYVGQSVCLRFAEVDNQLFFNVGIDVVALDMRQRR
jgi:hypothetical protein